MKLRQVASGWEFESEKDLEDLVWNNLEKIFGFDTPRSKDTGILHSLTRR
jgi:hypothetical protein